ncbi:hypothetical protein MNBD_GAMMA12-573 [hydrothermal vent metagenome]|uniref:Uncharacterized protein n=1 Tax=hydrothermal vent metagenome TaxID=652676 RepID=A0A3B0Z2X5_9ZZZZ
MFVTLESSEVFVPPGLKIPNEKTWWYTKMRLHIRWFYITGEHADDEGYISSEMYLMSQVNQLLELHMSKNITIRQIYLVSPSYTNSSGVWEMDEFSEILVGTEPNSKNDQEAYIFVLKNGTRYVDSLLSTKEQDIQDIKQLVTL